MSVSHVLAATVDASHVWPCRPQAQLVATLVNKRGAEPAVAALEADLIAGWQQAASESVALSAFKLAALPWVCIRGAHGSCAGRTGG